MDETGQIMTVIDNLLRSLEVADVKKYAGMYGSGSEISKTESILNDLKQLVDADCNNIIPRHDIEELKTVVYELDDLLDEILTLFSRNTMVYGKISRKVNRFFSAHNSLACAFKFKRQIRTVTKKLAAISNNVKFDSKSDLVPIKSRRSETHSYVYEEDVIGRSAELENIVDMLFTGDDKDVCFISIVGLGGVGKTTIAQLVFHDNRVVSAFQLRLWVCVSDYSEPEYDLKKIAEKILEAATGRKSHLSNTLSEVQDQLIKTIAGVRYLLILDDLWCENILWFSELKSLLNNGSRGSRIVITTRSMEVARIAGSRLCQLGALSEENSWWLFKRMAIGKWEEASPELVEIGREIVRKCCNVPLVIRVVGSLLYGQPIAIWQHLRQTGLARMSEGNDVIFSALKYSYDALQPQLKRCFSYCALFPKDFEIQKEKLVRLWMAHGYIVPSDGNQSLEEVGDEYFSILLQRHFFQDVKRDENGNIVSCKIHDLIHDLALQVAGNEICVVTSQTQNLGKNTRHIFHAEGECEHWISSMTKVRSYLQPGLNKKLTVSLLVNKCIYLRVLDLNSIYVNTLPNSIGILVHLRYLDLSGNDALVMLPKSLTRLYNLQTLNLSNCSRLKYLPKDLSHLDKIRYIDIYGCGLTYMPSGMDKLTSLHVLTEFIVAEGNSTKQQGVFGQLQDLKPLLNLTGCITISIPHNADNPEKDREGGYVFSLENLNAMHVRFLGSYSVEHSPRMMHEAWLEMLQPHCNLKKLILHNYQGVTIPRWGTEDWVTLLPNLVKIILDSCEELQLLPSLRSLRFLKSLSLHNLTNLEYMENASDTDSVSASELSEVTFYPSLEYLRICGLKKLKGWWREVEFIDNQLVVDSNNRQFSFPILSELSIRDCPMLTSFPRCPSVKNLCLSKLNENLQIRFGEAKTELVKLELDNMNYFNTLPAGCLSRIDLIGDKNLESLSEVAHVFKNCSSLRSLTIEKCPKLNHICRGLQYLTVLESLSIRDNPTLIFTEDDDNENIMSWRSLQHSLHFLEFKELQNMTILPSGMQYLTALQHLTIHSCGLKSIPNWISSLSSLQYLHLISCFNLKSLPEEMKYLTSLVHLEIKKGNPYLMENSFINEKDWPRIQHIPSISFNE